MKKYYQYCVIALVTLIITACHSHESKQTSNVITVYPRSNVTHLYYSGTIKPIAENLVISPAAGVISKMNFHYGEFVKKGDVLFSIHSPEMEREFREAITTYLRVKQAYLTSKKSMIGTEMLYKEKIISQQEYENEKGQFQNNTLGYVEATTKLKQFLTYLPGFQTQLLDTDEIDLQKAVKVLQQPMDDLAIIAPSSGIVLFPEEKSSDDKQYQLGVEVKKSDVLVAIGDLTGLAITANVTENDINNIQPGRQVLLTFQSNLEMELKGVIVSVARQAKNTENAGFSTFPVVINVPTLPEKLAKNIRVGMNAKLDILIEEPPSIRIPINAVTIINHRRFVKTLDSNGKVVTKMVLTGPTSQSEVTILRGLNRGDRVVVDD